MRTLPLKPSHKRIAAYHESEREIRGHSSNSSRFAGNRHPNLRKEAGEEMLVQHLLTERIFRRIFGTPDFMQRNNIAQEIEKVVAALTSRAFSRDAFLKELNRFYKAIEDAADTAFNELLKQVRHPFDPKEQQLGEEFNSHPTRSN